MRTVIEIENVNKIYRGGFQALKNINLKVQQGEIFALLGPNGAGKTTLISIVCGLTNLTSGKISVNGHDIVKDYREARGSIGLVPQELTTQAFETVWNTVSFTRGLFGKPANPTYIEKVLRSLSLWDKRKNAIMTLSGGMKRRVLIAKALSHEPKVLFLDEPTAGVDVELRKEMWANVRELQQSGVTVILTTHYIEEAEEMADRVGVISKGQLILVEEKNALMKKLGRKQVRIHLKKNLDGVPERLRKYDLELTDDQLVYQYDSSREETSVCDFLNDVKELGISYKDISTRQSTLEEIFVDLVRKE